MLARLARGEVPFSPEHVATLRRIMVLDRGEGWTLSGKTGLGELGLGRFGGRFGGRFEGWFVGLAERGGPDLRLRHLPARRDMKTFGPHRIALTGGRWRCWACCRKRRGGRGRRRVRRRSRSLKNHSGIFDGGREGCQAATGWLLAGRGSRQLHGSPWGTGQA